MKALLDSLGGYCDGDTRNTQIYTHELTWPVAHSSVPSYYEPHVPQQGLGYIISVAIIQVLTILGNAAINRVGRARGPRYIMHVHA
jgi:hypothetical protein